MTMTPPLRSALFRRIASLLLATATVIPAGCATSSETSVPAKEVTAMTTSDISPANESPSLSADEIGKRFLKLIEGLESRSDLNLDLVRTTLELKLSKVPWDEHQFISEGPLGSDWSYVVGFLEETPSNLKSVYLDFRNSKARFADMTPICELDFEFYHSALVATGFRAVEIRGEIGQLESWRYYKSDFAMQIVPQNVVPGEAGRVCANSISMLNGR